MKKMLILSLLLVAAQAQAETYIVTLTNGSLQPISPAAVYTVDGQVSQSAIGQAPTAGFIGVCQRGDANGRAMELRMNRNVKEVTLTGGPLMPGESRAVEINVQNPSEQSIHFEAMYAKSKDTCAVGSINAHTLVALKQHVTSAFLGTDQALQSGAFADPALPMGMTYLDQTVCTMQNSAVDCVRSLAQPEMGAKRIRFFNSYLSSLNMLLERKYGALETAALNIPGAGAVRFEVRLKH